MSFGFAIGDFVALARLAWGLYKQCKGASAEFAAVCHEVLSIHTALRELEDEPQNEDSILNRAGKGRQKELNNILQSCTEVLRQLETLVTRYRRLGTSQRKVWDRIKFGDEGIQVIRNKLVLHTSTLTLFLTSLGTGSLGRIEKKLDDIAAEIRAGHHEPSVITAVNDEPGLSQSEAWAFLFRELAEDFSVPEVEAFKGEIQTYIKQLVERGAFEECVSSCSDNNSAVWLTPPLSPSPSPVLEASGTFLAPTESRNSRSPPKPTAVNDSDDEGMGMDGGPPPNRLQPNKRATSAQTRRSSTWTRAEDREVEIAESTLNSNTVPSGLADDVLLHPIEDRDRESERWGESCKIGIEIGNDCCRVAAYDFVREEAVSLSDDFGCTEIPTCIAFTQDKILVGHAARKQAKSNLENTFFGFTCLFERLNAGQTRLKYQKSQSSSLRQRGQDLVVYVPCRRRHYTLVDLTANLLSYCRQLAEARCSSAALHVCITTSSNWGISTLRTLAEAAEVSGIVSPAIVSYGIAFALNYATRKQIWTRRDKLSSMIVNMSSRGAYMSQVGVVYDAVGRPKISLKDYAMFQHGFSIDEVTASSLIPEALQSKHYIKQIGMRIHDARREFLRGGERFFDFVELGNNDDFVSVPPPVDLSSIQGIYLEGLMKICQVHRSGETMTSCILTSELALLQSVQSMFHHDILPNIGPACILEVPSPDDPFNASKGAAELALHRVGVDEFLPYCLELQTVSQDHQTHFLVLTDFIRRGEHCASWSKTMHVVPQSTKQGGLYLKVVETDRYSPPSFERGVLFEAAIKIAMVSSRYSLVVSVDLDFNIEFKLQCEDGVQDDVVLAEIHCSNSRIVDLRHGNFVAITEQRRREWVMKSLGEELRYQRLSRRMETTRGAHSSPHH
ncbi:hypothetical protein GJ744_010247 [Endocarpon pusillum]|uniref:Fungal N-terminal domain-containing protein n=1 Tax=Endocarpon pusillum TaxID=364733 RepID=A0A8H7AHU2_9EURO|nr:hypothetical protein GJ744_010247 [Endocarpon pusillum]